MKLRKSNIFIIILLVIGASALIVFSLPDLRLSEDAVLNRLLLDVIPRSIAGIILLAVLVKLGFRIFNPVSKNIGKSLLWCIPCFLVIFANFPFSALIRGAAIIRRTDLIWLFIVKCLAIGLFEEAFFRGLVQTVILERFENSRYRIFISVFISSAVFGLWHLLNLLGGASIGATMLQIGYSFLIGFMLSVVLIKTENIWLCILIHALFDVGGLIIPDIGSGAFQDTLFWIFTAAAGVICAAHIILTLKKTKTCYAYKKQCDVASD